MYLVTHNKYECCGCSACLHICSVNAISMRADSEGFLYPQKDVSLCNNCGLCEKICPIEHPIYSNDKPAVFAAYAKDERERMRSSSGAIFYIIAKSIIARGGIVYGAILDSNLQALHIGVDTLDALDSLRGSKYVQTNLNNVFIEVKQNLIAGRLVYFTGTPCQIAGLKAFLRRSYSNLVTSDLICHGVPSQKLFDMHLKYLCDIYGGDKVVDYKFRDNKGWGGCEITTIIKKKVAKLKISPTYDLSPYLYSFMYGYTSRYSCYKCPFATLPRQGDITLADFWGVKEFFPNLDTSKGCSLVLLNNKKGCEIWNDVQSDIFSLESNIESASKHNWNMLHYSKQPYLRARVYESIQLNGYKQVAKTLFRSPNYWKIKVKYFCRGILGDRLVSLLKYILYKR